MGFEDVFKSNFLNNMYAVTFFDMVVAVLLAFLMGLFIFLVYHRTFRGVLYSEAFGFTLTALTAITTVLMLAVTSNVILSLGMVGALSIVRFRTAIKDPMEIVFLFWAIETGIVLAAGILELGIVGNILVGLFFMFLVNRKGGRRTYILVIHCNEDGKEDLDRVKDCLDKHAYFYVEKAVTPISANGERDKKVEIDYEVGLADSAAYKKQEAGQQNIENDRQGSKRKKKEIYDAERMYQELRKAGVGVMIASSNGSYTHG